MGREVGFRDGYAMPARAPPSEWPVITIWYFGYAAVRFASVSIVWSATEFHAVLRPRWTVQFAHLVPGKVYGTGSAAKSVMKSSRDEEPGKERMNSCSGSSRKMATWVSVGVFWKCATSGALKGGEGQAPLPKTKVARAATLKRV